MRTAERRRRTAIATAVALAVGGVVVIGPAPAADAGAPIPPTPTPERVGPPGSIASIGDAISTATGTADLGAEAPANSRVTGPPWVEDAVRWARSVGVVNGFADATFGPNLAINRGQFANSAFNQST